MPRYPCSTSIKPDLVCVEGENENYVGLSWEHGSDKWMSTLGNGKLWYKVPLVSPPPPSLPVSGGLGGGNELLEDVELY